MSKDEEPASTAESTSKDPISKSIEEIVAETIGETGVEKSVEKASPQEMETEGPAKAELGDGAGGKPPEAEAKDELGDGDGGKTPEAEAKDESEPLPVEAGPPPPRRPVWLHLIVLFFQILFLTPVYAALAIVSVGAGVGWHYYDGSAALDLGEVGRLELGALVEDAEGRAIGRAGSMNRIPLTREEIPPQLIDALLAAEDQRFFLHPGFDPVGSVRAAWANYRAEAIREGGSTLTQQLARDVYRLEGKDIDRKLSEIAAAVRIEKEYSKDEILVHYLNRIYFGSGFYGLGAAARGYFGKKPAELTVDESALICGVIPSPSRYSPFVSADRAKEFRDRTLRRMHDNGKLSEEDLERYLAAETKVAASREDSLERGQVSYVLARVERELRAAFADLSQAPRSLDGYVVRTSIDLVGQQETAKQIDRHLATLEGGESDPLVAAFVMLENLTGQVVISVGSHDFQRSEYDRALETKRPPGSAFLPFVYAAAFESGRFTPESVLLDAPFDNREMGLGGIGGVLGEWSTENPENRWQGPIAAGEALRLSKNSPAARLALQVGLGPLREIAKAAGIASELREMPGSLLGASEASLTELALAYTVFPNAGTPAPAPRLVREIVDPNGRIVPLPGNPPPAPAMKPTTALAVSEGLGQSAALPSARGKSGTTPTFTDAWHFGFDEIHTWGVWIGRDRFSPIGPLAFGGEIAAPLAEAIVSGRGQSEEVAPVASSAAP